MLILRHLLSRKPSPFESLNGSTGHAKRRIDSGEQRFVVFAIHILLRHLRDGTFACVRTDVSVQVG